LSLPETLSLLASKLGRLIPYHSVAVWIRRGETLIPEFVTGDEHRFFAGLQIPMGQGLSGWVAENRMPIQNGNPGVESGYLKEAAPACGLKSAIAVPLEGLNGVVGTLAFYHADRDAFTRDHLRILQGVSGKIGLAVENSLRFQHAESSSTTDELTGLMNARALYVELDGELSRSRRTNLPVGVVTLDLNNFSSVNERFGRIEGDRVLRSVGQALKGLCRDYDVVARPGGDEFILVLPGAHPGELQNKLEKLRSTVAQATLDTLSSEFLTASMGTAFFPTDGEDAAQLLSEAERRMYADKSSRRAPVELQHEAELVAA
jgi:diguanylate cyclase (GGDEF)-like protein